MSPNPDTTDPPLPASTKTGDPPASGVLFFHTLVAAAFPLMLESEPVDPRREQIETLRSDVRVTFRLLRFSFISFKFALNPDREKHS